MGIFLPKFEKKPLTKPDEDSIIYAIGDIHGRSDLLDKLHRKIIKHVSSSDASRRIAVYLGDYIDRGKYSSMVLENLVHYNPLEAHGFEMVYLCGNHEQAMLQFIEDPIRHYAWLSWGGIETLKSYHVSAGNFTHKLTRNDVSLQKIHQDLIRALPSAHKLFLENLKLMYVNGDYVFVHAGLRPHVPLSKQTPKDILTIRKDFIESDYLFEKRVVFGHTIMSRPFVQKEKIGIDTGAYDSGMLTALVLEGNKCNFLYT